MYEGRKSASSRVRFLLNGRLSAAYIVHLYIVHPSYILRTSYICTSYILLTSFLHPSYIVHCTSYILLTFVLRIYNTLTPCTLYFVPWCIKYSTPFSSTLVHGILSPCTSSTPCSGSNAMPSIFTLRRPIYLLSFRNHSTAFTPTNW